jgi:hypothetical protein
MKRRSCFHSYGNFLQHYRYHMTSLSHKMISLTRSKILVLFLILSHLLGFGLHSVFHNDLIVFSSSQEHQVFPHEDADHCKHIPLSEHVECNICLSSQSRIVPDQISLNLGDVQIVGISITISSSLLTHDHFFGSFSRRGPPSLLG